MCVRNLWSSGVFLVLAAASGGCATVAATAVGQGLFVAGAYCLQPTTHDTITVPIRRAEKAAREALKELDVTLVDVKWSRVEGELTRCRLEACLIGDEFIPVDVTLEKLSSAITKVEVAVQRDWLTLDRETAEEILLRIIQFAEK